MLDNEKKTDYFHQQKLKKFKLKIIRHISKLKNLVEKN